MEMKNVYVNMWDDKSHHGQLLFSNRYNCINMYLIKS